MAWVRIDDQAPRNRKMLRAGPAACWLWVCGLAYAQSLVTDGFISDEALPMIGVTGAGRCEKLAGVLVAAGLFERTDGGYQIHDYHAFNETAEAAKDRRQRLHDERAKAGRAGGLRSAEARRQQWQANEANPKQAVEANRSPDPTRPDLPQPNVTEPRARASGGTVLSGALPREHLSHVACDPTFSRCVPSAVHGKLKNLLAPRYAGDRDQADTALRAWYPTVWAALPETFVMPADGFKFWQSRFDPAFASTDAPVAGVRTTAPSAAKTADYLSDLRAGRPS